MAVNFLARQTQSNPVFFKMPIEVRVHFTDGSDTILQAMNDINNQYYTWIFNKKPNLVQFDPNDKIVLKQSTTVVGITNDQMTKGYFQLFQNYP